MSGLTSTGTVIFSAPRYVFRGEAALSRVAEAFGLPANALKSTRRTYELVIARQALMWILRQTGLSYPQIARRVGRLDHTTIMSGVKRAESRRLHDEQYKRVTDQLLRELGA